MKGGFVCQVHGGKAPQVMKAAKERLMAMVDPALNELIKLVEDASTPHNVRMQAIKDVLDRCGFGPVQKSDVNVNVFDTREELMNRAREILEEANEEIHE